METIQLYNKDAYQKEFVAEVIACEEEKDGYAIVLDQTAFFPEGGGQYGDRGVLNEIFVYDTKIKEGIIYHKTKKPLAAGTKVNGSIDWERRYGFMQNHSAEHIISGLVHKLYGYDNVGFHLGEEEMTLDFNGILTMEQLLVLEQQINRVIWSNQEIQITYPNEEELKELPYRSKKELEGQIRIITIQDVDICACCAPHVHKTGEIGLAKVISVQKNKSGVRVTVLAGERALNDYRQKQEEVMSISKALSAKQGKVASAVLKLQEEKQRLEYELLQLKLEQLKKEARQVEVNNGIASMETVGLSGKEIREVCNTLMERAMLAAVWNRKQEGDEDVQYMVGSKEQDVRSIAERLKEQCEGRGGGKAMMIQGTAKGTKERLEKILIDWRAKIE